MKKRQHQGFDVLRHAIMKSLESKIKKLGFSLLPDENSNHKAYQDHILPDQGFNEACHSLKAFESNKNASQENLKCMSHPQGFDRQDKAQRVSIRSHDHIIKKLGFGCPEECHDKVFLNPCLKDQAIRVSLPLLLDEQSSHTFKICSTHKPQLCKPRALNL